MREQGFYLSYEQRLAFRKLCEDLPAPEPPKPAPEPETPPAQKRKPKPAAVPDPDLTETQTSEWAKRWREDRLVREAADLGEQERRQAEKEQRRKEKEARRDERRQKLLEMNEQRQREREAFDLSMRIFDKRKRSSRCVPLDPVQTSQLGKTIPGSSLVRDFCQSCGEPIRVVYVGSNQCLDCKPAGIPGVIQSSVVSSGILYHGGRFHAGEW